MSYTVFINRYYLGESKSFSLKELEQIVSRYANLRNGDFGLELIPKKADLFEFAGINDDFEIKNMSISIDRPLDDLILKKMIFDILEIQGTCYFSQELIDIKVRGSNSKHVPKDMIEHADNGINIITMINEL